MRCLVGTEWGADMTFFKAGLITSVLDYGCILYNSAARASLHKLDSILYQATKSLQRCIQNNLDSSNTGRNGRNAIKKKKREQLALNYRASLQWHPTKTIFHPCWEKMKRELMTFVWPVGQKAIELTLDKINTSQTVMLPTKPPWMLPDAVVDFTLLNKRGFI